MVGDREARRPGVVRLAQILLYAVLTLRSVESLLHYLQLHDNSSDEWALIHLIITLSFNAASFFFVYMIGNRKNWARIAYLGVFLLGIFLEVAYSAYRGNHGLMVVGADLVETTVQLIALLGLFGPDASRWLEGTQTDHESIQPGYDPENPVERDLPTHMVYAELEASTKPLFVLKYRPGPRIRRILLGLMMLIFFSIVVLRFSPARDGVPFLFVIPVIAAGIMVCWSIFAVLDLILFTEIRLYDDLIVKEWCLLGKSLLPLQNARMEGRRTAYGSFKSLFGRNTSRHLSCLKGICYNESLLDSSDVRRFNALLAKISGRKAEDFEQASVSIYKLIREGGKE